MSAVMRSVHLNPSYMPCLEELFRLADIRTRWLDSLKKSREEFALHLRSQNQNRDRGVKRKADDELERVDAIAEIVEEMRDHVATSSLSCCTSHPHQEEILPEKWPMLR